MDVSLNIIEVICATYYVPLIHIDGKINKVSPVYP